LHKCVTLAVGMIFTCNCNSLAAKSSRFPRSFLLITGTNSSDLQIVHKHGWLERNEASQIWPLVDKPASYGRKLKHSRGPSMKGRATEVLLLVYSFMPDAYEPILIFRFENTTATIMSSSCSDHKQSRSTEERWAI
jgi:hypothetical protein